MSRGVRRILAAAILALALAPSLEAQSWRLRLDARAQMAAFRGVELDSVPGSEVIAGPTGGPVSPDGIIARCPQTSQFCYIFRPGERRRGGPAFTSADIQVFPMTALVMARYGFLHEDEFKEGNE